MKLSKIINTENKISAGRPHRNSEGDPRLSVVLGIRLYGSCNTLIDIIQ